jgi:hypothetical protein
MRAVAAYLLLAHSDQSRRCNIWSLLAARLHAMIKVY